MTLKGQLSVEPSVEPWCRMVGTTRSMECSLWDSVEVGPELGLEIHVWLRCGGPESTGVLETARRVPEYETSWSNSFLFFFFFFYHICSIRKFLG